MNAETGCGLVLEQGLDLRRRGSSYAVARPTSLHLHERLHHYGLVTVRTCGDYVHGDAGHLL